MNIRIKNLLARLILLIGGLLICVSCSESINTGEKLSEHSIIPMPQYVADYDGVFVFNKKTNIVIASNNPELERVAKNFATKISESTGINPTIITDDTPCNNCIELSGDNHEINAEGYKLTITPENIRIQGDSDGIFYGLTSLSLLMQLDIPRAKVALKLPAGTIVDQPRFAWRGIMLDESRHFFGKEKVKEILDMMSLHKLNKFHWHLTDAPGWRIEIKEYPKLTSIGAVGDHSNHTKEAQFYTREDIQEIVKYAAERSIEIIPEIDMPGHASAAVRAYPELSGGGSKKHPEFTFHPAKEITYQFLTNVLSEITELFPSKYIHIGADEVSFGNQNWKTDKDVISLMHANGLKSLKEVERYFLNRMQDSILAMDKIVIGWDEVVENEMSSDKTVAMWWRHDKPEVLKEALSSNFKVVLCPRIPLYFDFDQLETHKVGRKWGGAYVPVRSVYDFSEIVGDDVINHNNVLGVQANVWTEQIKTEDRLDFMMYPRLSALSEMAWSKESDKNFEHFEGRLQSMFAIYKKRNIHYFNYLDPDISPEPGEKQVPNWTKNFE